MSSVLEETRDRVKNWYVLVPASWALQTCSTNSTDLVFNLGKQRRQHPIAVTCRNTVILCTGPENTCTVGGTGLEVTKLTGTATYSVGDNVKYAIAVDQNVLKTNTAGMKMTVE